MKALDLCKKYEDTFFGVPPASLKSAQTAIGHIFVDLAEEALDIAKKRNVVRINSFVSILREQNDKWNAMIRIYEKRHRFAPFTPDGFAIMWERYIPTTVGIDHYLIRERLKMFRSNAEGRD